MYLLIVLVFFCIGIIISCAIFLNGRSKKANQQKEINEYVNRELSNQNFNVTRKVIFNDFATWNKSVEFKMFFCVDDENKKLAFIDYNNGGVFIVNFNELLNYEIYENNSLQSSAIGVGGFVGIMGAETTGQCKDLRLIIRFKNIKKPQVSYDIISSSVGIVKTSEVYRECMKTLQEAVSLLEVILSENKQN